MIPEERADIKALIMSVLEEIEQNKIKENIEQDLIHAKFIKGFFEDKKKRSLRFRRIDLVSNGRAAQKKEYNKLSNRIKRFFKR